MDKPNIRDSGIKFDLSGLPTIKPKELVFHHWAWPSASIADVHRSHLNRGFKCFGYGWGVMRNGTIYKGREYKQNAHILGHNGYTLGVGFEGDYHRGSQIMPDVQLDAGARLFAWLCEQDSLSPLKAMKGHNEYTRTACPGVRFRTDELIELTFEILNGREKPKREDDKKVSNTLLSKDCDRHTCEGPAVRAWQQDLIDVGENLRQFGADGDFGDETHNATLSFQRKRKLVVDGIVGPASRNAMKEAQKQVKEVGTLMLHGKIYKVVE